jgi:primosomal protein N''
MGSSPLEDMMAGLEIQLVQSVHRAEQAEKARLYTEVLELEQRIERLHTALAIIADRLATEG